MADQLKLMIDVLRLANEIIGSTKPIMIDSSIKSHYNFRVGGNIDDLYVIDGSEQHPITTNQVLETFLLIQTQFTSKNPGCSYFFERFYYNIETDKWIIFWGS